MLMREDAILTVFVSADRLCLEAHIVWSKYEDGSECFVKIYCF